MRSPEFRGMHDGARALPTWLLALAALALFNLLFAGVRFDFWCQLALSAGGLSVAALASDPALRVLLVGQGTLRRLPPALFWGVASAVLLYGIFWAGNVLSRWVLPAAGPDIDAVYDFRSNSAIRMALWIALVIAPGEEIFWRGYLQRRFEGLYGARGTVLAIALYAAAHCASGNLMLVAAAAACGAFWSALYRWQKTLWSCILSHILWDLAVFLVWPLAQAL